MPQPPPVYDYGQFGFRAWTGSPGTMGLAHQHRDVEANWVAEGRMAYQLGGQVVELPLRRLCLFWGAMPHRLVRTAPGTRCAWLTLPLAQVLRWGLPGQALSALLGGRLLVDPEDAGDEAARIGGWAQDLQRGAAWAGIVALEVEARCKRLALSATTVPQAMGGSGGEAAGHVETMAAFLAQHHARPLSVAEIARQVGLNPTYAQGLFRRQCGLTLIGYLTQVRVAEAQRRLLTTAAPVAAIGLACGFGSQSRFFEAFAAVAGTTPGRWRRLREGGPPG